MLFIPYQRLTLITELSREELRKRMRERTGPKRIKNVVGGRSNIFSGEMDGSNFHLALNNSKNVWGPEITGRIDETNGRVELTVTVRSNIYVMVPTALFIAIGFVVSIIDLVAIRSFGDFEWSHIFFMIFPYGLCCLGFNIGLGEALDELLEMTNGRIIYR